jgi:hypothetical protein
VQIEENGGRWRVTESELGHNHETRSSSGGKVKASKEGWKRESPVRKGKRKEETESEDEGETEDEAEETDDGESAEETPAAPRRRGRPPSTTSTTTKRGSALDHPRMSELKADIDSLANVRRLSLGLEICSTCADASLSPSTGPSSLLTYLRQLDQFRKLHLSSLRVHILAAARQRGFSMILDHRRCSQREVDAGAFGMMCWKGHSRFGAVAKRCEMNVMIWQSGGWELDRGEGRDGPYPPAGRAAWG